MSQFHISGAINHASPAYINRKFEDDIKRNILSNRWVLLLGPRQHGKTTGLYRIMSDLNGSGVQTIFIDLLKMPPFHNYSDLLSWFSSRIAIKLDNHDFTRPSNDMDDLESWLINAIPQGLDPIIILIDEASNIKDDVWRNAFYGQLRAIANERSIASQGSILSRLRLVFAGTFEPEILIDKMNSPFNVCEWVYSEDISLEDVKSLSRNVIDDTLQDFAIKAYDMVGGQPYLIQVILSEISQVEEADREEAFDKVIERFTSGNSSHFDSLFGKIIPDRRLANIVSRMAADGFVENQPASSEYKFLQILGIAKRDANKLIFRNKIYAEIAQGSSQLSINPKPDSHLAKLFPIDESEFPFMTNSDLKQITIASYRGAVNCYNAKSYRLALVGFGSALEALLIDWFLSMSIPALSAKVGGYRFDRYENNSDPKTWKLSTLMHIAGTGSRSGRAISVPPVLRDWRNLAHPAVALNNYIDEERLEPEARQASGMFSSILRDIQ